MSINIYQKKDIEKIAAANRIVAEVLEFLNGFIAPQMSLKEIDAKCEEMILKSGAKPAFKGLYGFPNTACISVNEVVIHGIPSDYKLQNGDIVSVDLGANLGGFFGDSARTYGVGEISKEDEALIGVAKDAFDFALSQIRVGMHFKELSAKIGDFITSKGYAALEDFCGHGIGRKPHEEPEIPNYFHYQNAKSGPKIREGMVFCIEPMICQKSPRPRIDKDGWAVRSEDGLRTSHYENCIAIINSKPVVLSAI